MAYDSWGGSWGTAWALSWTGEAGSALDEYLRYYHKRRMRSLGAKLTRRFHKRR